MKLPGIRSILFTILFGLLLLPALQKKFDIFSFRPLTGEYIPATKESFTTAGWFDGGFQKSYEKFFEEHIGFRNPLIRLYNQIDFSLFNTSHGGSVVVGKEGYLYESQYLVSHAGKDYIGEKEIDARLERIRFVTERLNEKGIHLLIAFAPSKADFFSEYIPDFYKRDSLNPTNYDSYRSKLLSSDIPFIDFNSYFLSVKKSAPYPLFPKQGIHWSEYGVYLSADSILKYFNQKFGLNLNTMLCNHVDLSPELRSTDYDLGDLCNVLYVMHHYDMPYPSLQFQTDPAKSKPNMLVVGDSFYWNIYYSEIPKKIFNGANFWYYNHEVYCDSVPKKQVLDIAHFQNAVEQQKIILVLTTESNLNNLGFGFFEMAYDMLHTDSNILRRYEQEIKNDPEWLKLVSKKAAERNITLDEMIRSDARWMLEQETAKKK